MPPSCEVDGFNGTGELRWKAVAHEFDDAALVLGDLGFDQLFAVHPERIESARLIFTNKAAVADHIGGQNCGKSALDVLGHG